MPELTIDGLQRSGKRGSIVRFDHQLPATRLPAESPDFVDAPHCLAGTGRVEFSDDRVASGFEGGSHDGPRRFAPSTDALGRRMS